MAHSLRIEWQGEGINEEGVDGKTGRTVVETDPRYFRPLEVEVLQGNPGKAERILGWKARTSFKDLVKQIVESDLERVMEGNLLY